MRKSAEQQQREHDALIDAIYGDVSLDADIEEMEEDILLREDDWQ